MNQSVILLSILLFAAQFRLSVGDFFSNTGTPLIDDLRRQGDAVTDFAGLNLPAVKSVKPPSPPTPSPSPSPPTPSPSLAFPSPSPSPCGYACRAIPGCATCFSNGLPGGGIVCSSCCPGFALCPGGTVCKTCNAVEGCVDCTCDGVDNPVVCDDCGANRFLDQNNDDFVPYCPLCLDFVAGCTSCIDGDTDTPADLADPDSITCTGCAGTLDLDDNECT